MDRTTGENYATVGGRRQFTDGPPGTTVTGAHMTAIQEEIMACIEGAGITPDANTLTQLRDSIFATVSAGGFFGVPAIGLSIGGGGEGAWTSGGNSTMEGEHHFTDFTLQSAHQLSVGSTGILIIRCTGTATINGSINGKGYPGASGTGSTVSAINNGVGGSGGIGFGGGGGGAGAGSTSAGRGAPGGGAWSAGSAASATPGIGGAGGAGKTNPLVLILHRGIMGGSGASTAAAGAGGEPGGTLAVASEWTICGLLNHGVLIGGGGGGGGSASFGGNGGGAGGGGGGGNFVLIVAESILGSGSILCDGGDGGQGSNSTGVIASGSGGGGGGGVAITVSKNSPSSLTLTANGGTAGAGPTYVGANGKNGFTKKYYPGA